MLVRTPDGTKIIDDENDFRDMLQEQLGDDVADIFNKYIDLLRMTLFVLEITGVSRGSTSGNEVRLDALCDRIKKLIKCDL